VVRARYGLERLPMRRSLDRIQAWIGVLLLIGVLVGAPGVALLSGRLVWDAGVRGEHAQAGWRQVPAVLTQNVPGAGDELVSARWRAPDGAARNGQIHLRHAAKVGAATVIWVDARGRPQHVPIGHQQTLLRAVLVAVLAWNGVSLAVWCTRGVVWSWLERCRMRRWGRRWLAVEPRWGRRYR
jgi:hypothetical protein